ncbi:pentatricopeptide repeat domain-containing protein 3, mitochondrial [Alligator sinensis]|uniref:Small ribosomal subunit protein mS39 n=1 Tax=Alligator sinensis TaxID=38654 RepID=A0A1U7S3R9_ALLSI|nr:pentatricopeptide repeat domain-containing protein 3, mitochondrial [Alligator sinensis]
MTSRRTGAPAATSLPTRQTRGCATRCRSVREEGGGAGTYQVPGRGGKEWYFPEGMVPPFPACAVWDAKMAVRWLGAASWRQSGQLRGRGRLQAPGSGRAQPCRLCSESASLQKTVSDPGVPNEEVVIPRRKTWDKLAVLQALASTVKRDPTSVHYMIHDDPFLIPRSSTEFHVFALSKQSGENAAKYIINEFPRYFEREIAEPHIPCLMPENLIPQIEEVSEAALKERIQFRKVKASVDMYDQLLQAGSAVSLKTTNSLLDLLCFYGDQEPVRDYLPDKEMTEEGIAPIEQKEGRYLRNTKGIDIYNWRENNNAERIFNLMPERNAHSYCTMIRGMVKHGAYKKAFTMYRDLLNERHRADVGTFNALLLAAPRMKENSRGRWKLTKDLLTCMARQNVQPNVLTFNNILKGLKYCGPLGKTASLQVLNEMKAVNIEPSLATFKHILDTFDAFPEGSGKIIVDILNKIESGSFVLQDPDDPVFFVTAMQVCMNLKDLELGYRVHRLLESRSGWTFLSMNLQYAYCARFFSFLCMMEQIDVVMKWYKEMVPSLLYPNYKMMHDLLQAVDAANSLEMFPQVWEDIKQFDHLGRPEILNQVLALMTRELHPQETQMMFANCAAEIKSMLEASEKIWFSHKWTTRILGDMAIVFSRAGRTQDAWNMLEMLQKQNCVPSVLVLDEVLNSIKRSNLPDQALKLVKLAADFSLPTTPKLASRVLEEFELSEEQKKILKNISDDSDSDSDSDK